MDIKEEILELFEQAEKAPSQERANRYVLLARKKAMKQNISLPKKVKRNFCKHCYTHFKPGKNLRVRKTKKTIIYTCLSCNKSTRYPI